MTGRGAIGTGAAPARLPRPGLPAELQLFPMRAGAADAHFLVFRSDPGTYERWLMSHGQLTDIARLAIALLRGRGTLIDVGANIGVIAVPVARSGSRVIAVEPEPRNCLQLHHAALANRLGNLRIHACAATATDGVVHLQGGEQWGHIAADGQAVLGLRLDSLLSLPGMLETDATGPDLLIKIDVEGHEPEVLAGAAALIAAARPDIIFESIEVEGDTDARSGRAKAWLEHAGYRLLLLRGRVLVPRSAVDAQEGHVCDYLAVPREREVGLAADGFAVRALTEAERDTWIAEMAAEDSASHRRHAAGVIARLAREHGRLPPRLQEVAVRLAADREAAVAEPARIALG